MSKKNEQGIVIGTKDEAFWTRVKQETEAVIEQGENNLILQRELLKIAKEKILLEKRK